MNEEQVLRERTFKEAGLDMGRRTFYTLRQNPALQADANSKLLGLLVLHLHDRGLISGTEIDDLLLHVSS